MDKLNYPDLIEKIITQHASENSPEDMETTEIVFDRDRPWL